MADKTIPQLTELTDATSSAILPIDSGVQTFKMTIGNVGKNALKHAPKNLFISVWDAAYTYSAGDVAVSNGLLYRSLKGANLNKPVTNGVWWKKLSQGGMNPQVSETLAVHALSFGAAFGAQSGFNHPAYSPELKRWVVGTYSGYFYYSDDNGETWTQGTEPAGSFNLTSWNSTCWSPELRRFVAVGFNGAGTSTNQIAYSDDGETWTAATNPDAARGYVEVIWVPEISRFVAVGLTKAGGAAEDGVVYSTNGSAWTQGDCPDGSWVSVAYAPAQGRLVAVSNTASGPEGDRVMFSDDGGATWEIVLIPDYVVKRIIWVEEFGLFIASTTDDVIIFSSTGEEWEESAITGTHLDWFDFAWAPELGVIICVPLSGRDIIYSFNGVSWTRITNALPNDVSNNNNYSTAEWSAKGGWFIINNRHVGATNQQTLSKHVKEFVAV